MKNLIPYGRQYIDKKDLSAVQQSLRNEKITNTDEFLVKKKEPLIIPPDIDIVPEPQSIKNKKQTRDEKIKDILKLPQSSMNKKKTNSTTENSIINRIRK